MSQKITVGGREFDLHPVPLIGLKAIGHNLTHIGTFSEAGIDALTDAIYYGIKRGAQDDATITRDFFFWNIDATNVNALSLAVVAVNQMVSKEPGQGEAGELQAGQ